MSHFKFRNFYVKLNENYKYKNTALINYLTVERVKGINNVKLVVNDVELDPTVTTDKEWRWNICEIRQELRETIPMSKEENDRRRLEDAFVYNSLKAISFYKSLTNEELDDSIFTYELNIFFKVISMNKPDTLKCSETYFSNTDL